MEKESPALVQTIIFFVPRDLLESVCSDLLSTIMEVESAEHGVPPKVVTF